MTIHIDRHKVLPLPEEFLDRRRSKMNNLSKKFGCGNFSLSFMSAKGAAFSFCAGDPEVEALETWNSFAVAMQIGSAMFASVLPHEEPIERMIAHEKRLIEASSPQYYTNAGNWLDAFWLAMVCREAGRLDELCEVPVDLLWGSSSGFDAYIYSWVDGLQGYWLRRGDVAGSLMRAMELSAPEELQPGAREAVSHLMYPVIPLFIRFLERDVEGFNEALADSLKWHKAYWSVEERLNDDDGNVALGPLAVACMARDSGLSVEVESYYLPKHLLEGSWLNEFPT
ncbi:immunity 49 family protein [Streptomyces sp. XM4193]|uniref:immunity 49 family protein n=1 Tax=Streptomyces sp. XM4193 TaxID=2929782 RepID=UPI001FF9D3E0|nr:immunity 49 family protein [Streptomyces sp. XM4193]MCK1796237.1 immunity 49 family protein [Streptomyces sp. XM4193]